MTVKPNELPDESILCPRSDRRAFAKELHDCLSRLEPLQKFVIHLRFWENLEIAQIALIIGAGWEETDRLLERTLQTLRELAASENKLSAA